MKIRFTLTIVKKQLLLLNGFKFVLDIHSFSFSCYRPSSRRSLFLKMSRGDAKVVFLSSSQTDISAIPEMLLIMCSKTYENSLVLCDTDKRVNLGMKPKKYCCSKTFLMKSAAQFCLAKHMPTHCFYIYPEPVYKASYFFTWLLVQHNISCLLTVKNIVHAPWRLSLDTVQDGQHRYLRWVEMRHFRIFLALCGIFFVARLPSADLNFYHIVSRSKKWLWHQKTVL